MTDGTTATAIAKKTAPNGVRILCEPIPSVRSVAVGVWCRAGVVDEPPALNGISHLTEHMFFKGTTKRTAAEISAAIDGVGGVLDAFTETENVAFYARVLYEHLPLAFDVLADIFLGSTVPAEELAKEKNVVAEEIRLYEDSPDDKIHDLVMRALEPAQAVGLPILGSRDSLAAIGRDEIQKFRGDLFTGDRVVVAGAGYLEPESFLATAEEHFGAVPAGPARLTPPPASWPPFQTAVEKDTEQTHFCLGFPALPFDHPDKYVFAALVTLLGGNTSSRLFRRVRDERGLAYAVFAYGRNFRDRGALVAYAGTAPDRALETRDLVRAQIADLASHAVGADEFRRTRDYLKGTLMLSLESTSARMIRDVRHEIYLGRYVSLEETLAGVDAVTPADILRLAQQLFAREPVVAAIGPNARAVATL